MVVRRSWAYLLAATVIMVGGPSAASAAPSEPVVPLTVGANASGQLGRTAPNPSLQIAPIDAPPMAQAVSGRDHNYAVDPQGTVWAWGENGYSQVGDGSTVDRTKPVMLGLTGVRSVASGHYHGMAVKQDGTLWTWGYGTLGQLGLGTKANRSVPTRVASLTAVESAAAGRDMSYAVVAGGIAYGWGANSNGEVGDGSRVERLTPVRLLGLPAVTEIAGGRNHGLAIDTNGSVWAWGDNVYGQVGDGTTTDRPTPRVVLAGPVVHVAAGAQHSAALMADGRVFVWGRGYRGQLGLGSTSTRLTPTQVPGVSGVTEIGGARDNTYAVRADGRVWSWGANTSGQVGDGTTTMRTSPVLLAQTGIAHAEGGAGHLLLVPASGPAQNAPPVAAFPPPVCTGLICTVTSTSTDPDGSIATTAWDFGDSTPVATEPSAQHTYGAPGTYTITLAVVDDDGASSSTSRSVTVSQSSQSSIAFRAAVAVTGNSTAATVRVPGAVAPGDGMLLFVTTNTTSAITIPPAGWTQVGTQTAGNPDMRTTLFFRVAGASDAGSSVPVSLQTTSKLDLTLLAYSGTHASAPIQAWASKSETVTGIAHSTPPVNVTDPPGWVLSYWADKSSTTVAWVPPPTEARRISTVGTGSGRLATLAVDSGASAPVGAWPGVSASATSAGAKVVMFSVVLRPGG
jgi:alpha-tubulin suppressor-like RCC1 family protein